MKLHNLRFGFANNSSSSHSLIFVDDPNLYSDRDANGEYGWNDFLLVSKEEKARYLGTMLYNQIKDMIPDDIAKILFKKYLNARRPDDGHYIDHQSNYVIPRDYRTGFINFEFFNEFVKYVLNKNIIITGGNDNDDNDNYSYIKGNVIDLPITKDLRSSEFVARKDKKYNYWTLFNKRTGTKIRFSFNDFNVKPVKSTYPELVDIKITDQCFEG